MRLMTGTGMLDLDKLAEWDPPVIGRLAFQLAGVRRFANQLHVAQSVAAHSVAVCKNVWLRLPPMSEIDKLHAAMSALLHDASEAVLTDTPGPLRQYVIDSGCDALEQAHAKVNDRIEGSLHMGYHTWAATSSNFVTSRRLIASEDSLDAKGTLLIPFGFGKAFRDVDVEADADLFRQCWVSIDSELRRLRA